MRQKRKFCNRLLTAVLCLTMVFTSVWIPELTVLAAQTPTSSELTVPFGQNIVYDSQKAVITAVWGNAGDEYQYCISITGKDTTEDYAKVYDNLACAAYDYEYEGDLEGWEKGKTYQVELQSKLNDEYSEAVSTDITIPAGDAEEVLEAPATPVGLVAQYWDTEDANQGKIKVEWGQQTLGTPVPSSWKIYIDEQLVGTETAVAAYFYENTYAEGDHEAKVIAVNDIGESQPATTTFTLTADQAGDTGEPDAPVEPSEPGEPGEEEEVPVGASVVVSEQQTQAFVNQAVVLKYVADEESFLFGEDYTVSINGAPIEKTGIAINAEEKTITLPASLFADEGVYTIQFAKADCEFTPVYQSVFSSDSEDKWNLIWNDEFEGNALDETKWDYQTGNGSAYGISGWGNSEEEYYTNSPENTAVGDGTLTITAKKDNRYGTNYSSARLRTVTEDIVDGKAEKGTPLQIGTYGRIEAKMKLPTGDGIWPAFWMLPYDSEYGTWATSGELDIMEARGRTPNTVCGTIHYGDVWPNNSHDGKDFFFEEGDSFANYHIYSVEWDPTEIRWLVDGEVYGAISNWYSVAGEEGNWPYPAPFDEEFYVLLNLAVGGTFDSSVASDQIQVDENGVTMDVDYVRWYQRDQEIYENWDITEPDATKDTSDEATALLELTDEHGNFIADGDFSAMNTTPYTVGDSWAIERGYWAALLIPSNGGGEATWSKVTKDGENYLKVGVTNAGSQTYSSQMLQYFPVVSGYSYEISYKAYTDTVAAKGDVSLKIGGDGDNNWAVYSGNYTDELTTTPTTYTHKFTMTANTDPTARFEFNLATSTGNVYLSDVCVKLTEIRETDGEDADKTPLSDGNHVYNGSFNVGTDSLLYWHWNEDDKAGVVTGGKDAGKNRVAKVNVENAAVSLWQFGINLLENDNYKLTFGADSSEAQDVTVKLTSADGQTEYAFKTISLNAGAQEAEFTFVQPEGQTDPSAKLMLTFEKSVSLSQVKLIRTSNNNIDFDAMDIWPIYNGDFFNGKDGWNIWSEGNGWQSANVNEAGQLESQVQMGADASFYHAGIQSSEMKLSKGIKYRAKFDYTLPSAKNYTLELAGVQREITLEAGSHTYVSEPFSGAGNTKFTLYLGPDQAALYTLLLDNVEVYIDPDSLTVPAGYAKPVSLAQDGRVKAGQDVVVSYSENPEWEAAEKEYFVEGEQIDSTLVSIDAAKNKITIAGSVFAEAGSYQFAASAIGFTQTKPIKLAILEASENFLLNGNFSNGTSSWGFYYADWGDTSAAFTVNEDGEAVINHQYNGGEDWHIQLFQEGIEYPAGDYVISFDAWADVERPIGVQIQNGNSVVPGTASKVLLSTEKKSYTIILKNLAAATEMKLDFPLGSMTYEGITAPNDGTAPYNIYMDNVVLRTATNADFNSKPGVIASAGAAKVGTDVTVTYTEANDSWKEAAKTVYVNGTAVDTAKIKDNTDHLVIDKSVFASKGRYSIYVLAENYEATNTINKNILGKDNNRIFGGDMNDAALWMVYNEDEENLSKGAIANGIFKLDYTAGYYRDDWSCWVTWSSQLRKENISVEQGKNYVLRFEAGTDLTGGRDIILEYGLGESKAQQTVHIEEGKKAYQVMLPAGVSTDEFFICYLLGPIGENLQIKNVSIPHELTIDNVSLREEGETAEGLRVEEITDQTFTGSAIKPQVIVYDGDTLLANKDYSVSYKANTKVGTATVTVTGKGNYSGKDTTTFQIVPKNLGDTDITAAGVYAVISTKNTLKNPKVTVKYGKKTLKLNTDYTIAYPDTKNEEDAFVPGHYVIKVTAKEGSNYTGSMEIPYEVRAKDTIMMSKVKITLSAKTVNYDGEETVKPDVQVTYGSGKKAVTLTEGTDYTVSYENWNRVGNAKVTIHDVDGSKYFGSKTAAYKVTGLPFKTSRITLAGIEKAYVYTGEEITVEKTLKVSDKLLKNELQEATVLEADRDYTVSYKSNIKAGTATVILTGTGAYTGTIKKTFKINKLDISTYTQEGSSLSFACDEKAVYTKSGAKPAFTLTLNAAPLTTKDYSVSYKNNKKTGNGQAAAEITIKGKGNFTGSIKAAYEVTTPAAQTLKMTTTDILVPKKLSSLKTTVKVIEDATGKALSAGTDYDKKFAYFIKENGGEREVTEADIKADQVIHVRVTLKGNYAGSEETPQTLESSFRLYGVKASSFKVEKIPNQVYTGQEIKPALKVTNTGGEVLTEGVDYSVTYSNNIKKGTAKAVITGIGNGYGGSKTVTFKITAASLSWAENAAANIIQFFSDLF